MFELIGVVFEVIFAALGALIEAIAALILGGGEAIGAGPAILLLLVAGAELVWWLALALGELCIALWHWRRPRSVARPRFWRPKPKAQGKSTRT